MTDHLPPLTDEDLSAVLDDEAGPELVARVQADTEAAHRLDALEQARHALRRPVAPLEPAAVDDLVGRALAADGGAADGRARTAGADAEITPLPVGSGRKRPPGWLAAAAIVALVAVGLGLIWSGQHGNQDDVAQSAGKSASQDAAPAERDAGDGADRAGSASTTGPVLHGGAAADGSTTTLGARDEATAGSDSTDPGAGELVDLGRYDTGDDLRTALATSFPTTATAAADETSTFTSAEVKRCADQVKTILALDDPLQQGRAVVAGADVLVYELAAIADDGTPTTLVAAVDGDTCQPVVLFQR